MKTTHHSLICWACSNFKIISAVVLDKVTIIWNLCSPTTCLSKQMVKDFLGIVTVAIKMHTKTDTPQIMSPFKASIIKSTYWTVLVSTIRSSQHPKLWNQLQWYSQGYKHNLFLSFNIFKRIYKFVNFTDLIIKTYIFPLIPMSQISDRASVTHQESDVDLLTGKIVLCQSFWLYLSCSKLRLVNINNSHKVQGKWGLLQYTRIDTKPCSQ